MLGVYFDGHPDNRRLLVTRRLGRLTTIRKDFADKGKIKDDYNNYHQGLALQKVDERIMTLNVGPQHPGSGHMRLIVQVDGDYIVACDPDPGYVHRGEEKMAEYRNYILNIPHLERPVIHDSCNILYPYCLAAEEASWN